METVRQGAREIDDRAVPRHRAPGGGSMRRHPWIAVVAVVALATGFAVAGEYEKCTASTQECLNMMAAKMKNSGWVGIEMDREEETGKLTVVKVIPGSPAQDAGIQPGDVLHALYGIEIAPGNEEKLMKARKEWKPGQSVEYTIKRDGEDRQVQLTLAPMPADVLAQWIGQHMLEHAAVEVAANK